MPQPPLTIVGATADIPQPSRPLGSHGRSLWDRVMAAYDISDVGGIEMLAVAASAIDRAERCRERINLDGEMIKTRTGMRSHPLIRDELQALALAMRTMASIMSCSNPSVGRERRSVGCRLRSDHADQSNANSAWW
jgi:hypothetical protein